MKRRIQLFAILILFEIVSALALEIAPRDETYYLVAGAFSFLILPFIAAVGSDQLVIDLLYLALIMLVFQFIGFLVYHFRFSVGIYNYPIRFLLAAEFLRLIIVRGADGVDKHNNFMHLLRGSNLKRGGALC